MMQIVLGALTILAAIVAVRILSVVLAIVTFYDFRLTRVAGDSARSLRIVHTRRADIANAANSSRSSKRIAASPLVRSRLAETSILPATAAAARATATIRA